MNKFLTLLVAGVLAFASTASAQDKYGRTYDAQQTRVERSVAYTPVEADVSDAGSWYVGTDYQFTKLRETAGNDTFNGVGLNLGTKLTDNFGLEAGVNKTFSEETGGTEVSGYGATADAIFYFPVATRLDLLTTAGLTYNEVNAKNGADEDNWGWAAGAGAQYALTDTLALRGLARYEESDLGSFANDGQYKFTAGLQHKF